MPRADAQPTAVLRAEAIDKVYRTGAVEVQALHGVSLTLDEGELVVLLGASGSGKSTLLNILGGLDRPTSGQVWFRDRELTSLSDADLTLYRRAHVGFVFQFYNLVPSLTARENVALVTEISESPMRPEEALEKVGLAARLNHFPAELSGGEQQRVAIARAIAKRPDLLLCDEPTGALDSKTGVTVLEALVEVNRALGAATVLITHNAAIQAIADRVITMADGHIASDRRNPAPVPPSQVGLVMRALDRKLLRDLRRIWAQSLAIALVLACGIMVLVMSDGTLRSLSETRAAFYDRNRFADVFAGVTRAPRSLLEQIAAIDGVAMAEARVVLPAVLDLEGMTEPATARVLSLPPGGQPALNLPLLRQGRLPDPLRPDEVLLGEPFAEANALHPGDRFHITLNGQRRELVVAGVVLSPEFIYTIGPGTIMPDNRHFGLIWMNEAPLAAAADLVGAFNDLTLSLSGGTNEAAVIAALDRLLAPYGGTGAHGRDRQVSHVFINSEFQQLTTISVTIPPVFLVVSAFLVNMVLGRLIALERSQIGLLKALGYATADIAAHYLKIGIGIGLLGLALGLAAGWRAGQWMTNLYAEYFRFPWLIYDPGLGAVSLSASLGLGAVVLGALRAVWASARLAPAVAMAPPAPPAFRRGWVDGFGRLFALRQTTMMILRSISRWPGRAAVTFLGVSASIAVLMACFFIFDAMDLMMDELFVQSNRQDVTLVLAQAENDIAVADAATLPGVRLAEGAFALPVRLTHGAASRLTTLQARPDDAQLTRLLDTRGQAIALPSEGLVLPERLAERLGVEPGDQVLVELLTPPRETWEVEVAGLIRQSLGEEAYMAQAAVFRRMRQPPQVNQIHLMIDPLALDALNQRVKSTPVIAGLTLWTDVKAEVKRTTDRSVKSVTLIFSLLGMLIAVGVVYNAARIQLAERAHELASLRVLGFSRAEVGYVLVGEMMLLGLIAVPVGWGLGYAFAALVHQGFSTDVVSMPFQITRRTYGLAALMVLAAVLAAALWVRRGLDRVDLVQALKQKE